MAYPPPLRGATISRYHTHTGPLPRLKKLKSIIFHEGKTLTVNLPVFFYVVEFLALVFFNLDNDAPFYELQLKA